jgi:hypothetical protein
MPSWKGGPPNGTNKGKVYVLQAWQNGHTLAVEINYDKVIWSGLSWAVGEIRQSQLKPGDPVTIRCVSAESDPVSLIGKVYRVQY